MDLYSKIKNISGNDKEKELVKSISAVKEKLNGLTEERMCKVYSSFLLKELTDRHVPSRLINTLDLGLDYEHMFILVPCNECGYFLADLTFSQFNLKSDKFDKLLSDCYQFVDDDIFTSYFSVISKNNFINSVSVDNVFYSLEMENLKSSMTKR